MTWLSPSELSHRENDSELLVKPAFAVQHWLDLVIDRRPLQNKRIFVAYPPFRELVLIDVAQGAEFPTMDRVQPVVVLKQSQSSAEICPVDAPDSPTLYGRIPGPTLLFLRRSHDRKRNEGECSAWHADRLMLR
jgi:hypothetical protein